jgi:hypothetical protein
MRGEQDAIVEAPPHFSLLLSITRGASNDDTSLLVPGETRCHAWLTVAVSSSLASLSFRALGVKREKFDVVEVLTEFHTTW